MDYFKIYYNIFVVNLTKNPLNIFVNPKSTKSMKSIKLITILFVIFIANNVQSQESILKLESLPIDSKTNCYILYYYFPNLEAYFDNLKMVYYYKESGKWLTVEELPENYGGYSLYNKVRVNITNYDDENPYQLFSLHKKLYPYNSKGRFTNATANTD